MHVVEKFRCDLVNVADCGRRRQRYALEARKIYGARHRYPLVAGFHDCCSSDGGSLKRYIGHTALGRVGLAA